MTTSPEPVTMLAGEEGGELTPEFLVQQVVPYAARLVGTVHDFPPEETAKVLAEIPGGRADALLIVLAAMVPTDRTAYSLLSWVTSEDLLIRAGGTTRVIDCGTPEGYDKHCREGTPKDAACRGAHARRRAQQREADRAACCSNRNVA